MIFEGEEYDGCSFAGRLRAVYSRGCDRFRAAEQLHRTGSSRLQMALAWYQVVLCGWFFALCVSDILDIRVNFSYVRFAVNVFYALEFSALAVYTFFYKNKCEDRHFRCVIWAYIALTAVQCFVFPYETENEIMRIIEAVEGAAVSAS